MFCITTYFLDRTTNGTLFLIACISKYFYLILFKTFYINIEYSGYPYQHDVVNKRYLLPRGKVTIPKK